MKSLRQYTVFIDRNQEEILEENKSYKPNYQGKSIEEVYKERLSYYKSLSSLRFSPPPYSLLSGIYKTKDEFRERVKETFVRSVRKRWITPSSNKVPLPPNDSFFACTDGDYK